MSVDKGMITLGPAFSRAGRFMFPLRYIAEGEATLSFLRRIPWFWGWLMMIWRAIRCYYDDWGLSRSMPLVSMTVDRSALEREPPKLTVELNFLNYSLYDVQMNGVAGRIRFAGAELSGDVEGAASREIAERFQSVRVSATVWISETEAKSILDASGQNHLHFGLAGLKIYASAYRPVMGAKRRVLRIPDDIQVRTDGRWRVEGITDLLLDGN